MQTQQTLTRDDVVKAMQSKYRKYQSIYVNTEYTDFRRHMQAFCVLETLDQIALDLGIDPDELSDPKYSE